MSDEIDFDPINNNDDVENSDEEEEEFDDEDLKINPYENQDTNIDNSAKNNTEKQEEEQEIDINDFEDLEYTKPERKEIATIKNSGYPIVSFIEHTKLYSTLCDYLSKSKIDLPHEMEENDETKSCDVFRIARFWIENRHKYPLPLTIDRHILGNRYEKVDVNGKLFMEDLDFHDDNHDEHRFHYNFRDEPYSNIC